MVQRFYSDLVSEAEIIRDAEGVEADSIEQARFEARRTIADMKDANELPASTGNWRLQIRDARGCVVETIRLR